MNTQNISRRGFLKKIGAGVSLLAASACSSEESKTSVADIGSDLEVDASEMAYRVTPSTGDKVSLLGYGCMRWPTTAEEEIDQEMVNRLVRYALDHGVNYFDTSPAYCKGKSEEATGIALKASGYDRSKFFIATKLSNFAEHTWSYEEGVAMFERSLKYLQTDYVDYLLLHGIGMGGMKNYRGRYEDNGLLEYLLEQRRKGRIRNLGFSYHGDVEVFDYLLSKHDEYKWDFVQIQLNYVDWRHAKAVNKRNTDAEYLYSELTKLGIPAVIMEPLLGGRLAKLNAHQVEKLKQREPQRSVASWAFRYCGTFPGVLTVLSGMTYMEHLKDNLSSYAPFVPLSQSDLDFLEEIAEEYVSFKTIPCNDCKYCMPCPYGIDIPANLLHYNKCINEGIMPREGQDEAYAKNRRAFLIGYDRSVPKLRQAAHCIGCGQCSPHCPQRLNIPQELRKIDLFVEQLKQKGSL